jgi:succinate dehydrogenase/fumarate reductase flavoprotein subunit
LAATAIPTEAQWPGGTPSRAWYRERVVPDVIDWTSQMGMSWLALPSTDVELRAPVGGGRRLTDTLWQAAARQGVEVELGVTVTDVSRRLRVSASDGRRWDADVVVLAGGGWAADLPGVRDALGLSAEQPLLNGALPASRGSARDLALALGASQHSPADVVLYGHGTPDPADPERALVMLGAERAYLVDTTGQPQPWLHEVRGDTGKRLMALPGGMAWAILDGQMLQMLQLQGSGVDRQMLAREVAERSGYIAPTVEALAEKLSLPAAALQAGVAVAGVSMDTPLLPQGPYAALPLLPMTAKSVTGIVTDADGRVLDAAGVPVPGLFAAGEAMGFGHPYGTSVLDSTMIAGAILTGRSAGRAVRAALPE